MKISKIFKNMNSVTVGCIAKDVTIGEDNVYCKVTKIKNGTTDDKQCWGYWYSSLENVKKDKKTEDRQMWCEFSNMRRVNGL